MNPSQARVESEDGARPRNPFPKVPEIRLGGTGATVQVETDAVRRVRHLAVDFLTARSDTAGAPDHSGRVAAILGEYGTGKSHLAWTLMDEVGRIAWTRPVVLVVSGQPRDTVLSIYRRLLAPPGSGTGALNRSVDTAAGVLLFGTVERMVEDLCADLRRDPGEEPDAPRPTASEELTVDEMWRLHQRLLEIAGGDDELATVLGLVWHTTAGSAAWRWLSGDGRDSAEDERLLADRGVHSPPVDSDMRALRVLRALSRLCGWTGGRMVLVLDELHQIRPHGGDGLTEVAATLMELIGWAVETGALLVVCGLLDFWEALPQSIRGRVATKIVPSGLTPPQIRDYISSAQRPDGAEEGVLHPFTDDAVAELWKLTDGHPRRTITLCHHAYELTSGTALIGPRQIREASLSLCAPDTPDHVRGKLAGWCIELGYHVSRLKGDDRSRWQADLKISSPRGDGECTLVVSGPVLEEDKLTELRNRAAALMGGRRAHPRSVVLVMAGPLAAAYGDDVADMFTHVLHWESDTFREDLAATLRARVSAADEAGLYELVLEMRREIGALRAASFPAARAVPEYGDVPARTWKDPDRQRRAEQADRLCRQAREALAVADANARKFWRTRFGFDGRGIPVARFAAPGDRYMALGDIVDQPALKARGTLAFIDDAVREFGAQVGRLLADEDRTMQQIRADLRFLHRKFDHSLADVINMFPDVHEDRRGTVMHVLGVNRPLLNQFVAELGATVYSVVVAAEPEETP
ncbi:hypothetical protein E1200_15500 [Actinomadura sp. GC306]|uniref:hypothetical protein n=1 Tax=Actinomadura sp. GC306 TaxID=2530367 RepID=UPI001044579E|nr:hypothetical protein [Actinomadura sp. GC306]TDC67148.1 hypothetical protein E1200_15500 [Actinomadura sp. GC306]